MNDKYGVMDKIDFIIELQKRYQETLNEYKEIILNNQLFDKIRDDNPREKGESYFDYQSRLNDITHLSYSYATGYKAKLNRLRIMIAQAMLELEKEMR